MLNDDQNWGMRPPLTICDSFSVFPSIEVTFKKNSSSNPIFQTHVKNTKNHWAGGSWRLQFESLKKLFWGEIKRSHKCNRKGINCVKNVFSRQNVGIIGFCDFEKQQISKLRPAKCKQNKIVIGFAILKTIPPIEIARPIMRNGFSRAILTKTQDGFRTDLTNLLSKFCILNIALFAIGLELFV
jgi:hypothetical protein